MTERCAGPATTHETPDVDPTQDTIALLHEEVARLEAELLARDDAALHAADAGRPGGDGGDDDGPLRRRVEELTAELAARDETVALLLDQARLFEEAAWAQRAEWDQLHQWVEEVERRVEGKESTDAQLRADLDVERRRSETMRQAADSDRRGWDAQRRGLEREVEHLRGRLTSRPEGPSPDPALDEENRRLRAAVAELERAAADAGEVDGLRRRLAEVQAELDAARAEVRLIGDERQRERIEHEAALNELRTQLAQKALARQAGALAGDPAARSAAIEADERIRAFRQHLAELHDREAEERAAHKGLASRLSHLWHHTGPGR